LKKILKADVNTVKAFLVRDQKALEKFHPLDSMFRLPISDFEAKLLSRELMRRWQ
jgi:hypothetical protein